MSEEIISYEKEIIFSHNYPEISPGDSIKVTLGIKNLHSGNYQILTRIRAVKNNETLSSNLITLFFAGSIPVNYCDIVINELMYAPVLGEPEWIEIYNRSYKDINLKKWTVSDKSTTAVLSNKADKILGAGKYAVRQLFKFFVESVRINSD
jgi:hypothetical protein